MCQGAISPSAMRSVLTMKVGICCPHCDAPLSNFQAFSKGVIAIPVVLGLGYMMTECVLPIVFGYKVPQSFSMFMLMFAALLAHYSVLWFTAPRSQLSCSLLTATSYHARMAYLVKTDAAVKAGFFGKSKEVEKTLVWIQNRIAETVETRPCGGAEGLKA